METSSTPGARTGWTLLAILLVALGLRVPAALRPETVFRDTIQYVTLARAVQVGAWDRVFAHGYPPGYPAGIAALASLQGADPGEPPARSAAAGGLAFRSQREDRIYLRSARLLSALLGAFSVLPIFWLGRRLGGRGAGLWAAGLLALQPWHATISRAGLSEATFLFFDLLALAWAVRVVGARAAGRRGGGGGGGWLDALGFALVAGAAYLVRPEALAVVLAAAGAVALGRGRRRTLRALALAAPFLALALAYAWKLSAVQGRLVLTPKKDIVTLAVQVARHPGGWLAAIGGNLLRAGEVGHPLMVALSALGIRRLWRARRTELPRGARFAGLLVGLAAALHLAAASAVRTDPRFALAVATLLLPAAGLGAARVVKALAGVGPLTPRTARGLVCALVLGATLPVYLHQARPKKPSYRDAAQTLEREARSSASPPRLYAEDTRLPYEAGLPWAAPRGGRRGPEELRHALTEGSVALVALTGRSARGWRRYAETVRAAHPSARLIQVGRVHGPDAEVWLGRVVRHAP